jgi:hypothetical protein
VAQRTTGVESLHGRRRPKSTARSNTAWTRPLLRLAEQARGSVGYLSPATRPRRGRVHRGSDWQGVASEGCCAGLVEYARDHGARGLTADVPPGNSHDARLRTRRSHAQRQDGRRRHRVDHALLKAAAVSGILPAAPACRGPSPWAARSRRLLVGGARSGPRARRGCARVGALGRALLRRGGVRAAR